MKLTITKLTIKNFRGISAREDAIGEHGVIARGRNGAGKTSVLRAIRAALAAQDIGPDAIRHGAESAEILVDLDALSVRRTITKKGSTVSVTKDGFKAPKPQAFLNELLGTSPLDPIDLMLLKPKERRARILEALPCAVTREQLAAWAPGLPASFDVSGHGLEVVERARKMFYDKRTEANAKAKESAGAAERAREAIGEAVAPAGLPDVAAATAALETVKREEQRLALRRDEARAHEERTAATRERIQGLRVLAGDVKRTDLEAGERALEEMLDALASARAKVAEAEKDVGKAEGFVRFARTALGHRSQATDLEASLAAGASAPTADEEAAAANAVAKASTTLAQAKGAEMLARQAVEVKRLTDVAEADADAAEKLDAIVKTLANEAPTKLLSASDAIPGLTLDGEEVLLDGKRLDGLCGAEQMKLCVEIARRANAQARFLVVDGLERLDPEQMDAFVVEATRDGWQLLGSRVDRGDVVLEAIETDEHVQAAE